MAEPVGDSWKPLIIRAKRRIEVGGIAIARQNHDESRIVERLQSKASRTLKANQGFRGE